METSMAIAAYHLGGSACNTNLEVKRNPEGSSLLKTEVPDLVLALVCFSF